ncbi:uncharacterized protein LOC118415275 [Branchiostoma floridae]|uniref:Uncharacterized protein LOC118415275 n=1 Tax=Branchiostoma floridae TaxID=7739 RepID=A0A9J7L3V3_BRAFL|nr:uncharacterized protein LOC118415275 [Branchiostoma floridae]
MPTRCVAAYCSNYTSSSISLHKFPNDEKVREKWVQNVRRTRGPDREGREWTPSPTSRLCSDHFTEDCFDPAQDLKRSFGFNAKHRREVLPGKIPTIFPRGPAEPKRRESQAVAKRRHQEILRECLSAEPVEEGGSDHDICATAVSTASGPPVDDDDDGPPVDVTPTENQGIQVQPDMKSRAVQARLRVGTCKGVQIKPTVTTIGIQNKPSVKTISTQTQITYNNRLQELDAMSEVSEPVEDAAYENDPDYEPMEISDDEEDPPEEVPIPEATSDTLPDTRIFMVFWTCLVQLFSTWCCCPACPSRKLIWHCKEVGTHLLVTFLCRDCSYEDTWRSQPSYGRTAAGNILLSSAILFAGASVTKVLRVLSHMGVAVMSTRSFFRHQENILFRAIRTLWRERQFWMLTVLQAEQEPIVCGGDGRADSPGHSAKYGTYTMMELKQTAVIDVQLVQSNEVDSSNAMEKEGLQRSLQKIQEYAEIGTLVTDRHAGINKMIREQHPNIQHLFDVWHVAKSIKKKLKKLSKTKGCEDLKVWIASIINHLYWAVTSTPPGNGDLIVEKWKSVLQHIHNRHRGFGGLFPRCAHGRLRGRERRKPWLSFHTKVSVELEKIVCNKQLCKALKRLSPSYQTSYLEAFHSLILHFAPKMYHYSYQGMENRVILAALHFNENAHRAQARTRDGDGIFSIHFPKYKQGGHIVRRVLEQPTFGYVMELVGLVKRMCGGEDFDGDVLEQQIPEPLSAACDRPNKADAVRRHTTRFAANNLQY